MFQVEPEPELYDVNVKAFALYNLNANNDIVPTAVLSGTDFTWVTAQTAVSITAHDLVVYGTKEGPYVRWYAYYLEQTSGSLNVPANSYYYLLHNVPSVRYFGSYEEDEIADFFTKFEQGGYVFAQNIYIQGDHMDSTVFTHWFS